VTTLADVARDIAARPGGPPDRPPARPVVHRAVQLDAIEERHERVAAPESFGISAGTIQAGSAAALRFEVLRMRRGHPVTVLEHVTRLRDDLAPAGRSPQAGDVIAWRCVVSPTPRSTFAVCRRKCGTFGPGGTGPGSDQVKITRRATRDTE
jgi:hypothetical protein